MAHSEVESREEYLKAYEKYGAAVQASALDDHMETVE